MGDFHVVKSFSRTEAFEREFAAYQRLQERNVTEITVDSRFTFAIPKLIEIDRPRLLLVMTLVFPPYVLDFGKCYVDYTPDYSPEVIAETEEIAAELFGRQWRIVRKVLSRLRALGIYYVDAKPGNIEFKDADED